jgi:hypothetical protein
MVVVRHLVHHPLLRLRLLIGRYHSLLELPRCMHTTSKTGWHL